MMKRIHPRNAVDVTASARVLAAILDRPRNPPSFREIAEKVGTSSLNDISEKFRLLKRDGMITQGEKDKARTVVAKCRWIPAEELIP